MGVPALVDHKASRAKHCKQGEFIPEWKITDRGQMKNSNQVHGKIPNNKHKFPQLHTGDFISTVHLKQ